MVSADSRADPFFFSSATSYALKILYGTDIILQLESVFFYFLITYGVCKKRKYYNRMTEKKNSLLLTNVHDFYVVEDKTSKKKFPSVCLSVWMYVRTWTFHGDTITFEGVRGSKQNLVGVFHV